MDEVKKAIDEELLEGVEMGIRNNELSGLMYTEEEKKMFREACTSEEDLHAVVENYVQSVIAADRAKSQSKK